LLLNVPIMIYQIDNLLAGMTRNLWKPIATLTDLSVTPSRIAVDGTVISDSLPLEGPETDSERFFTAIWHSAKPSRWKMVDSDATRVTVAASGKLIGEVGFDFVFVKDPRDADGKTKFRIPWEVR
jgi:hypothetical protein